MSFTDEQLLNLVNNSILKKTEFQPEDFTGGSIQITCTNNNRIINYRVHLFFGYKSKKPITRSIEISEEMYDIWAKAIILKSKSIQVSNNGMDYSELNDLMNNTTGRPTPRDTRRVDPTLPIPNTSIPNTYTLEEKKNKIELPEWLNIEAWENWEQHRKEIRKKITPTTRKKQLAFLEANKGSHVQIINQSIQNGWTGLFELKTASMSRTDTNMQVAMEWANEKTDFDYDAEVM